jgi:aspartate carbamoyltransferase catalytic subunit
LTVAIVGDLLHSRVARSNLFGLRTMGARVRFVGPTTLVPSQFAELGAELVNDLHEGLRDADVIMMLRIQRERMNGRYFSSLDEYSRMYCLSADAVAKARKDVIILHPGPMNRGVEISSTVADGPYSVIMDQVTNGVAVRMAALYVLVGRRRGIESSGEDTANEPVPLRRVAAAE